MSRKGSIILAILLGISAAAAESQAIRVWLWDNDNGRYIYNPDTSPSDSLPSQFAVAQTLSNLGYVVQTSPGFNAGFRDYDLIYVTNGWRGPDTGAGIISPEFRDSLIQFMQTGRPVILDGNDVAKTYGSPASSHYDTAFLRDCFGVSYASDSSTPVSLIRGGAGTPFDGLTMAYAPWNAPDSGPRFSVDEIGPDPSHGTAAPSLFNDPPGKSSLANCRGVSFTSPAEDLQPHGALLMSFVFSALRDSSAGLPFPDTKAQLMRRIIATLDQDSPDTLYPAAPANLRLVKDTAAMTDSLRWNQSPDERITGYRVCRFDNGGPAPAAGFPVEVPNRLTTQFADDGVMNGNSYLYKVQALARLTDTSAADLESKSSNEVTAVFTPLEVTLSFFTAAAGDGGVLLQWRTESERDCSAWLVERSGLPGQPYGRLASLPAAGSMQAGREYSYADLTTEPSSSYFYRLGCAAHDGTVSWFGPLSVAIPGSRLTCCRLAPVSPNPAAGAVSIAYEIPDAARVSLKAYDAAGRLAGTIADGWQRAGRHTAVWQGNGGRGRLAAGVYFLRLVVSGATTTQRLVIIR
jgi:hypothetical protein